MDKCPKLCAETVHLHKISRPGGISVFYVVLAYIIGHHTCSCFEKLVHRQLTIQLKSSVNRTCAVLHDVKTYLYLKNTVDTWSSVKQSELYDVYC